MEVFASFAVIRVFYLFLNYFVEYFYRRREDDFYSITKKLAGKYSGPRIAYKVGRGGAWIACRYLDKMGESII